MRIAGGRRWLWGVAMVFVLAGCAGTSAGTAVPVADMKSVAGKWTGLIDMASDPESFVELTIDESGAYRASAARTIGVMDAQGKIVIVGNGGLVFKGDSGSQATATLFTQPSQSQRTLVVEGVTPAGRRFSARLHQ
jgi:hypothetical protein